MMKFAKTCPLIDILGLYLMSNSLNSMAYFTSPPEVSGLCNICFIGCSGWSSSCTGSSLTGPDPDTLLRFPGGPA